MGLHKMKSVWRYKVAQKVKKKPGKVWKDVADRIMKPRENLAEVNIGDLAKHTNKGETVVVPGKVLGMGKIGHAITVAALSFSDTAREKILAAKGVCMSIEELAEKNPEGKGIRIMG